ncbi:MAG TPA: molybdenum cofactor guanylyltransferase MobA [Burkholderiaceae bacterium]
MDTQTAKADAESDVVGDVTGLILSGGRGSRMDNDDKGLQLLEGVPLVQHVLTRFKPQVKQLVINANRNIAEYRLFGVPVWHDDMPNYAGPLAGLQAGLARCETPYLATAPCDSPFLAPDLVERLMHALAANHADLAFAVTGSDDGRGENEQRAHPVFALMRADLLPQLTAYLLAGGRKVSAWQATLKTAAVHFPDSRAFRNINSHGDLRALEGANA